MQIDPRLSAVIARQPYPLLFVTISGAHLYGFPSANSDFDLRGAHLLPAREVVGLDTGPETIAFAGVEDGLDIDLVTHEARKFFLLLLKKNGYVLEQLTSPLIFHTTPAHAELQAIASQCLTRHHSHHYFGLAATHWKLLDKERPRRVKPLLYLYRALLTGIHLMRTGQIEANLVRLNESFRLPHVTDLIALKTTGPEGATLLSDDLSLHEREYDRLRRELEAAHAASTLPDHPTGHAALHNLLVRLRLGDL